jgi:hypothetical protein
MQAAVSKKWEKALALVVIFPRGVMGQNDVLILESCFVRDISDCTASNNGNGLAPSWGTVAFSVVCVIIFYKTTEYVVTFSFAQL